MSFENHEEKDNYFRLMNLPQLARIEIINQMTYSEQIKLATRSIRMMSIVKQARVKADICTVILAGYDTRIALNGIDVVNCNSWEKTSLSLNPEFVNITVLTPDINPKFTVVEDTCVALPILQKIIICKSLEIELDLDYLHNENIGEILRTPALHAFEHIKVNSEIDDIGIGIGGIGTNCLNLFMETAVCKWKRINRSIKIIGTQIPLDYYHKNAFKFFNIHYEDARWVRPEYLYSLRNRNEVTLGKNNFTPKDFHAFAMYWVFSRYDMVRVFTANLNETLAVQSLFSGITFLHTFRSGKSFYLVSSSGRRLERKQRLWVVQIVPGQVIFTACAPNESISIDVNGKQLKVSFEPEFWAIQRLKKTISNEYKLEQVTMKREEATSEVEIQMLEKQKALFEKDIDYYKQKLEKVKLYYQDGIPTIDEAKTA